MALNCVVMVFTYRSSYFGLKYFPVHIYLFFWWGIIRTHERLETVGKGVSDLRLMTQVRAVRKQEAILKIQILKSQITLIS